MCVERKTLVLYGVHVGAKEAETHPRRRREPEESSVRCAGPPGEVAVHQKDGDEGESMFVRSPTGPSAVMSWVDAAGSALLRRSHVRPVRRTVVRRTNDATAEAREGSIQK